MSAGPRRTTDAWSTVPLRRWRPKSTWSGHWAATTLSCPGTRENGATGPSIGLAQARGGGVADALTTLADAANDVIGRLGAAHHGMGRRILATAARTSLEAGDVATAEDMVARAQAATEHLPDYLRPVHLVDIAWVWASIDRPDRVARALAAADAAYRERDERPGRPRNPARVIEGMADIGKGWALVGDLAMARMLPGELHPYYEATLWREVASARADAGNLDAAREAFGEAIEAASRIEAPPPLRFPEQWTPGPYHGIEDFLAGLGNAGYGLRHGSAHPRDPARTSGAPPAI